MSSPLVGKWVLVWFVEDKERYPDNPRRLVFRGNYDGLLCFEIHGSGQLFWVPPSRIKELYIDKDQNELPTNHHRVRWKETVRITC